MQYSKALQKIKIKKNYTGPKELNQLRSDFITVYHLKKVHTPPTFCVAMATKNNSEYNLATA